jgi:hypothetical protein
MASVREKLLGGSDNMGAAVGAAMVGTCFHKLAWLGKPI